MPRVLIPSNDAALLSHLAGGYAAHGYEALVGSQNFLLSHASFDLIHMLWPEQLCWGREPDDRTLVLARERLEYWSQRSTVIFSVNNIYPHGFEGNQRYHQLYELFYRYCDGVHHYSEKSRELANAEWPVAASKPYCVTAGWGYESLLNPSADRAQLRRELGYGSDDFVVLVFGALRSTDELKLIQRSFARAKVPNKKLLVIGKFCDRSSRLKYHWWRLRWQRWLNSAGAKAIRSYVRDEDIYRYMESCDAIMIPRLRDLSSGSVGMGMSFGKIIIAPDHGAFPDYLSGTQNLLYPSGDSRGLAAALEQAYHADRQSVRLTNRRRAQEWTWPRIVGQVLELAGRVSKTKLKRCRKRIDLLSPSWDKAADSPPSGRAGTGTQA